MALYELSMIGTIYGEQMVNRFHYMTPNPGVVAGGAQDLAVAFNTGVLDSIRLAQTSQILNLHWDTITVRDMYDASDFGELVGLAKPGTNSNGTDAVPPFLAVSYRSPRYRTGKNRAYKRIAGIPEGHIVGNVYADAPSIAATEAALVTALLGGITGVTFLPQLLFLERSASPPYTYAYYATEVAQRAERALLNQMDYYRLTTQRTRIQGHGA